LIKLNTNKHIYVKLIREIGDNSALEHLFQLACRHLRSTHTYKGGKHTHETQVANQRQKDLNVHRSGLALNRRIMKAGNPTTPPTIQTKKKVKKSSISPFLPIIGHS